MAKGQLAAAFKGLATDAEKAAVNITRSIAHVTEQAAEREEANLGQTLENEARTAKSFSDIHDDGTPKGPTAPRKPAPPGEEPPPTKGGQESEGNGNAETGRTDPVDVVSGQMLMNASDVVLPGLLPLALRRAYASGYRGGRSFGPGWSSTVDQRVTIDRHGVHFYGDDAQTLHYPTPTSADPVLAEFGARWPLTWDRAAGVVTVEDPVRGWTWRFDVLGPVMGIHPLTELRDRNGHTVTYLRDADGVATEVRHSGGYRVAVDRAVEGPPRIVALRVLAATADATSDGTTVLSFRYDERGRLTGVLDPDGTPYAYEYDDADRITARTDRNGWRYDYQYDGHGRVVRGVGQDGYMSSTLHYDVPGRTTIVTDALGHATTFRYDGDNHISEIVDALGNTTTTAYDRYGNLSRRTDALGNTTVYARNEWGHPIAVGLPDGMRVAVTYAECGMPSRIENPDGALWRHEYDERGNLLSTVDPVGARTAYDYDDRGHLVGSTDAHGNSWRYDSDGAGRPLSVTTPIGATTRYRYDEFGRVVEMIAADGGVHRYGWTTRGKQAWYVDPTGARGDMAYDAQGNLVASRDGAGGGTLFEVGPFDRMGARISSDNARYTFGYDANLQLTTVTNPAGAQWTYEYDAVGNIVAETDFAGRTVTYRFDAAGRQIGRTDANGTSVDVSRDQAGRIVVERSGDESTEFTYDPAGRLIGAHNGGVELAFERDPLGRVTAETIDGLTVTTTFDELGRRVGRSTPHNVDSAWQYTATGWESALSGTAGRLAFEYDASGRETQRLLAEGVVLTQTFDEAGRLAEQRISGHAEESAAGARQVPTQRRGYHYRADGTVAAITDLLHGDRAFELTPSGRVTGVDAAGWQERYQYDLSGNIVELSPGVRIDEVGTVDFAGALPRSAGSVRYVHDAQGRLVRVIRRTLSGQQRTWSYTWNGFNRLVEVATPDGHVWRYRYDPLGRRIAKHRLDQHGRPVDEVRFVWDGTELVEQRQTRAGVVTVTTWDYRAGANRPLAQTTRSWLADAPQQVIDSRFHAIVTDLVGAPAELVAADGRIAWRRTTNLWGFTLRVSADERIDCPIRFPGQYHDDETGLEYNYFRYYDSATGRYLTPDPLGLSPSPNNYGYVANPVMISDPLGLASVRDALGQFARDPNAPPTIHNRDSEFPSGYRESTHDAMAANWTDQGRAQGGVPVDANGVPLPHDQLTWRDGLGQEVPYDQLTYEHIDPVVEHWNSTGYDTDRGARNDWYNNPDNLVPMTKKENSSGGGKMTSRYRQDTGPNYSCGRE